jgi:hypothetical protein
VRIVPLRWHRPPLREWDNLAAYDHGRFFMSLLPCHRVVRRDGAMSGSRWRVERKRVLLEREAVPRSRVPLRKGRHTSREWDNSRLRDRATS